MNHDQTYDLVVIGGGINGVGIARDAAGRGLKVLLCEQDDLGQHTSSASSKLIHGGLRYLEHCEFGLVRKSLLERDVLWRMAPHLIQPLTFVLPHQAQLRPAWMIRLGLYLYDYLSWRPLSGRSSLAYSKAIRLQQDIAGQALKSQYERAFVYSDCRVDDSRLVMLNAVSARQKGATILPRTRCESACRFANHWELQLQPRKSRRNPGLSFTVNTRVLVNAAGPWVDKVLAQAIGSAELSQKYSVRLVKGSHILVPKLFSHDKAYIFQNPDGRIVFAIPYRADYTLIGTTEEDYVGDPAVAEISPEEISYLCKSVSTYFKKAIDEQSVVWHFAGVRTLFGNATENATAVSRDYALLLNTEQAKAPLLSVFGGKLTTYRTLALEVVNRLKPYLNFWDADWTHEEVLPGGNIPQCRLDLFIKSLAQRYAWLPEQLLKRYVFAYGSMVDVLLKGANKMDDLGKEFTAGLYAREVEYLCEYEWAETAEDILWRRTKLGINLDDKIHQRLQSWLEERHVKNKP